MNRIILHIVYNIVSGFKRQRITRRGTTVSKQKMISFYYHDLFCLVMLVASFICYAAVLAALILLAIFFTDVTRI